MPKTKLLLFKEVATVKKDYSFTTNTPVSVYDFVGITETENVSLDYVSEPFDIPDKELDEGFFCKCIFRWEGQRNEIKVEYLNESDEVSLLYEAKKWFLKQWSGLEDLIQGASDVDIYIQFLDNYLKAIADMKLNTTVYLDQGFSVEIFMVSTDQL